MSDDRVLWKTEEFDYGMSLGLCGQMGEGANMIRAAIRVPFWHSLSSEQRDKCMLAGKDQLQKWLTTKQNVVYADQCLEGNEISVDVSKLLETLDT